MPYDRIIIFDGVCNLCNASVKFVIRHDPKKKFHFLSLQDSKATELLKGFQLETIPEGTFILISGQSVYTKSTAALRVARELKGAVRLLYAFIIIPPFIRDLFYNLVARNRYRWFGKKDSCMLPNPEIKERFI